MTTPSQKQEAIMTNEDWEKEALVIIGEDEGEINEQGERLLFDGVRNALRAEQRQRLFAKYSHSKKDEVDA